MMLSVLLLGDNCYWGCCWAVCNYYCWFGVAANLIVIVVAATIVVVVGLGLLPLMLSLLLVLLVLQ